MTTEPSICVKITDVEGIENGTYKYREDFTDVKNPIIYLQNPETNVVKNISTASLLGKISYLASQQKITCGGGGQKETTQIQKEWKEVPEETNDSSQEITHISSLSKERNETKEYDFNDAII